MIITKPKWSDFMAVKLCVVCGSEFVANSNRQKYCSDCSREVRLAKVRATRQARRANRAALDKPSYSLGPNLPKSVDWDAEARKVKNEVKRTYRNYRSNYASANDSTAARDIAIEEFTYDVRDDDFKGSIDDFFSGNDDE
jgi:hypothetical protein